MFVLLQALSSGAVSHFEPQVAVLCDPDATGVQQAYHPQYMNEQGHWQTDLQYKASSCLKDKMDILDYCKKVYPKRDITNIVESSHYLKVGSWCRTGAPGQPMASKCKTARWVKPFRCLEGPFQSDALLVPENCLFDHIHNQSKCWTFGRWNETAAAACHDRGLQLRSFAMLLPCGISLFSGVEFVCCPRHFRDSLKTPQSATSDDDGLNVPADDLGLDNEDDDDEDDDQEDDPAQPPSSTNDDDGVEGDEGDDYDDEDGGGDNPDDEQTASSPVVTPSTTSTTTQAAAPVAPAAPTPDPYFTHFDPRVEHQSYKEAQERLEESHREKVTRVMKDWSDLEERYQDMRATDPRGADAFKQRMTQRFQQTVQALEEEGDAEKHQLAAMHQQRVLAHINQRKKEAMVCYTQSLNEQPANTHRVQKCLQKLLRALHKDRAHAIAHYRHLLAGSLDSAAREQPRTLERLTDIDRTVNQSLQMLRRYPELTTRIGQLMDDYVQALRSKDETPGSLLAMTTEAEAAILDKYRTDVAARRAERERQRQQERARKEQRKKERMDLEQKSAGNEDDDDEEDIEDESIIVESSSSIPTTVVVATQSPRPATVDDAAVQQAVEEVAAVAHHEEVIRMSHSIAHDLGHGEPTYSVRREVYGRKSGRSVYFTLAFAGMALMAALVVGVAVARRRSARSPHSQGFVEVDQAATPEERHVANMQINGYENPTYKYFEVKE